MGIRLRTNGLEFYSYKLLVRIYYLQCSVSISELKTLLTNAINYNTHFESEPWCCIYKLMVSSGTSCLFSVCKIKRRIIFHSHLIPSFRPIFTVLQNEYLFMRLSAGVCLQIKFIAPTVRLPVRVRTSNESNDS